jgi:hypothetical protein
MKVWTIDDASGVQVQRLRHDWKAKVSSPREKSVHELRYRYP